MTLERKSEGQKVSVGAGLETQSRVWAPYGIAAVLQAMESEVRNAGLGDPLEWTFPDAGKRFQENLPRYRAGAGDAHAMDDILKTCAQVNGVDVVNRFLKKNGYSIQLERMDLRPGEIDLAAASIIDILVAWRWPGKKTTLRIENGVDVDAAHIRYSYRLFTSASNLNRLIGKIDTKSDITVYLANCDKLIVDEYDLERTINSIRSSSGGYDKRHEGIIFPMVDFEYKGRLEGLEEAVTRTSLGKDVVVKKALVEQRLRINEIGARAQQAAALYCVACCAEAEPPLPPYTFDGDKLLVWFERPGQDGKPLVVYSALITPEHMKNPGPLK